MPAPGVRVSLSPEFNPPILKGIKVHPDNPLRFEFILDKGDSVPAGDLKQESTKLIKYFLASLTIPEKDLWVNLSPYEKNRIIPQSFGLTEMGRDLLAEDYMLKQITASLIYPEGETGKKFWKRIYAEASKKFGTTNIPVNTFNKVWILPEKAVVYENVKAGTAYVVESKLKVMLEQDYLALSKANIGVAEGGASPARAGLNALLLRQRTGLPQNKAIGTYGQDPNISAMGCQIIREIVIPELTKEVNEDKNFSQLRQVYNSLILATWYKKKIKDSILAQVYENRKKVTGVGYKDSVNVQGIYQRYLKAFKKGIYNYIKEEVDPVSQQTIPRKYFSGGATLTDLELNAAWKYTDQAPVNSDGAMRVIADLAAEIKMPDAVTMNEVQFRGLINRLRDGEALGASELEMFGFKDNDGLFEWVEEIVRNKISAVKDFHPQARGEGLQAQVFGDDRYPYMIKILKADRPQDIPTALAFRTAQLKLGGLVTPFLLGDYEVTVDGRRLPKRHGAAVLKVKAVTDEDIRSRGKEIIDVFFSNMLDGYTRRGIFDHDLLIDRLGITAEGKIVVLDFGISEILQEALTRKSYRTQAQGLYFWDTFHTAIDKLHETRNRLYSIDPPLADYFQEQLMKKYGVKLFPYGTADFLPGQFTNGEMPDSLLAAIENDFGVLRKGDAFETLNGILADVHFYEQWQSKVHGVEIPGMALDLIKILESGNPISPLDRRLLNRLLLQATYPSLCPELRDYKSWTKPMRGQEISVPLAQALRESLVRNQDIYKSIEHHYVYPFLGGNIDEFIIESLKARVSSVIRDLPLPKRVGKVPSNYVRTVYRVLPDKDADLRVDEIFDLRLSDAERGNLVRQVKEGSNNNIVFVTKKVLDASRTNGGVIELTTDNGIFPESLKGRTVRVSVASASL